MMDFLIGPACGEEESYASEEDGCCNARGDEKDCILSKPLLRKHIQQDLSLLENQLPFFILDELHNFPSLNKINVFPYLSLPVITFSHLLRKKQTLIRRM